MRWTFGIVGALLGLTVGVEGAAFGLAAGALLGWALEREKQRAKFLADRSAVAQSPERAAPSTEAQLHALRARVERLEQALAALTTSSTAPGAEAQVTPAPIAGALPDATLVFQPAVAFVADDATARGVSAQACTAQAAERGESVVDAETFPAPTSPPSDPGKDVAGRATAALKALLFGGNTVVRVGVLVLIIGVGLLARYAAEQSYLPLELRLALAAALGVALIVVGFWQRGERPGFSTALQGGGVAALYLVTFFAHERYALLPAGLTLVVMIAVAATSSVLAVAQNAQQLAVFGAIGGFLAPLLASRGEGDHVVLFGYYALLNAAIAGIALFRSWRLLNWVGFAFTFGIASAWGALRYEPAHLATSGGFLALFFAFYLLSGTLFALRQPVARRGIIDTTLTFGTPLATLGLASGLLREVPLYLALACAAVASSYLGVASYLLARRDAALRALAQAYVAVGIGAATIAIPLALDDALATALAWAVESAGLVWVGSTQQRLRTRVAGYSLYAASLVALLSRIEQARPLGRAIFLALLALCLGFGATQRERHAQQGRRWERRVGQVLLGLAVIAWIGALEATAGLVPVTLHDLVFLSLTGASVLGLDLVGARVGAAWPRAIARFAFPFLLLYFPSIVASTTHPFAGFAWVGWCASFVAGLAVLHRQRAALEAPDEQGQRDALHASAGLLLALLLSLEARVVGDDILVLAEGWVIASTLLGALVVPALALARSPRWPLAAHPRAYVAWSGWPVALVACAGALLAQVESPASPAPLPYLPLLNPLDLTHVLALGMLLALARRAPLRGPRSLRIANVGGALSLFVLLSGGVVRTAHHWLGVPFSGWELPDDPGVQAAFSILWTLLALLAMLLGHRRGLRAAWLAGASLIGVVVIKLFSLDLAKLGSVAKIITFLAVGLLLLLIGYVAPVPPAARARQESP